MMNRIVFSISICLLLVHNCFAQSGTTVVERDADVVIGLTNIAYVAPTFLILLAVHESGHCAFAFLGGAENIRFGLNGGGGGLGWANWNGKPSGVWDPLADLGGVIFTRGLAEGTDGLVRNTSMPNWAQRFFSMMFIESRLDFQRYVLMDATLNLFNSKGADFDDFVTKVAGRKTSWRTLTYSALITISIFDLVWDWDRISQHWEILKGGPYGQVKPTSQSQLRVHPFFSNNTIGVHATLVW